MRNTNGSNGGDGNGGYGFATSAGGGNSSDDSIMPESVAKLGIEPPVAGGEIIGIDLGTSTSSIAVLRDGRPELIADGAGDLIIPSVVQLTPEGELIVGSNAKASGVTFYDRTIQEVKRLIGTGEKIKLGDRTYTPEEISTVILKHLKEAAELKLGVGNVRDIVLSVPARFENAAREATRRAAEMAGLNVLRLINEPTAAALSYGLDRLTDQQKVLVFDFGGGTLDVTILEMFEGVLDVKTSVGDDKLGGKDVDDLIIQLFRDTYKEQHKKKLPAPSKDRRIAQMLKEEAEEYKKQLTDNYSVEVELPYLTPDGGLTMTLSRTTLDDLMEDLLTRAMSLVNEALSRARLRWNDIDVVLPIGGSSRLGLFRRALEVCWGKPIQDYGSPDEAVAKGAAIAAGIERRAFETGSGDDGIMILDVSPHRLGVATIKQVGDKQYIDDYFSELIPKDAKLPAIERRDYATLFNGQDSIDIRVYEATSDENLCRHHRLIAHLSLQNAFGDGSEPVQVEFRYNLDGILSVAVSYKAAPAIRAEGRYSLAGDAMKPLPTEDDTFITEEQMRNIVLLPPSPHFALIRQCEALMQEAMKASPESASDAAKVRRATDMLQSAVKAEDENEMRRVMTQLNELLYEVA